MNDFDDLLSDQPDVPDWPGLVRGRIAVLRRRRRVAATTTATAFLVLGTVGAVYAVTGSPQAASPVLTQSSDTPTPEATTEAPPTALPQEPTPTSAAPTASPSPSAPDVTPTPSERSCCIGGFAGTGPPNGHQQGDVTILRVVDPPTTAEAGQPATLTVDGRWSGDRPHAWATTDLHPGAGGLPCDNVVPSHAAGTGDDTFSTTVTFDSPGDRTAYVFLGNSCDDYWQGKDMVEVPVQVTAAATPTPTPSTTPTPTPAP